MFLNYRHSGMRPTELGFTRVRQYHCPSRQQPTWMAQNPGYPEKIYWLWISGFAPQRAALLRGPLVRPGNDRLKMQSAMTPTGTIEAIFRQRGGSRAGRRLIRLRRPISISPRNALQEMRSRARTLRNWRAGGAAVHNPRAWLVNCRAPTRAIDRQYPARSSIRVFAASRQEAVCAKIELAASERERCRRRCDARRRHRCWLNLAPCCHPALRHGRFRSR